MSRSIRTATALSEVSEIVMRDGNNVARTISERWIRDANNVPRQVWGGSSGGGTSPLSVSANPTAVSGAQAKSTATPVPTNSATVSVTGGVAPYTYAWGAQPTWQVNAPAAAQTAFTALAVAPNEDRSATFICTVTDSAGATATTAVEATASNLGGYQ